MKRWVRESLSVDQPFQETINRIEELHGPVGDIESMFTDLDSGGPRFNTLTEEERDCHRGNIRRCIHDYFESIHNEHPEAPLYRHLAGTIAKGDAFLTFNYDVCLERELVRADKFRVRNGYGFPVVWDEPDSRDSDVIVLKLHGSVNWIGVLFGGATSGYGVAHNSLGPQPLVDNSGSFLPNYESCILSKTFAGGGCTDPSTTLILPTLQKQFSVSTLLGSEWIPFYQSLWCRAAECLQRSDKIVLIGYSMPYADQRSRDVLLGRANKGAEVALCCGDSNKLIKPDFERHGFSRVHEIGKFADLLAFL